MCYFVTHPPVPAPVPVGVAAVWPRQCPSASAGLSPSRGMPVRVLLAATMPCARCSHRLRLS